MTPAQRTLRARAAALTRWANCDDRTGALEPARDGMVKRFERQVDPDGVLPPHERAIRADKAMRAHMTRMALLSAQARARKKAS